MVGESLYQPKESLWPLLRLDSEREASWLLTAVSRGCIWSDVGSVNFKDSSTTT
jgi:hypothetical protein